MRGGSFGAFPFFYSMEQQEIWKDVKGYEGLYQVSNLGRFSSFYNVGNHLPDGKRRIKKPHKRKNGYFVVVLTTGSKSKYKYIHRLVAEAFCDKQQFCDEIDHIDCDKSNNKASNLRWVNHTENINNPLTCEKRICVAKEKGVSIDQYSINGEYINTFYSLREIARVMPNVSRSRVRKCANGEIKSVCGYIWKYSKQ